MKIKDQSVNIWGLQPQMQPVLKVAAGIWDHFLGTELVITSGRDSIHGNSSWHYFGFAVDFRTWDSEGQQIDDEIRHEVAKILRIRLAEYSPYYDVIEHSTHIHVEWDVIKAGKLF